MGVNRSLHFGALWIVNMVNKLRTTEKTKDFVAKFNESSRAFLAQRCTNSHGRYLMIAQYMERLERSGDGVKRGEWRALGFGFAYVSESH